MKARKVTWTLAAVVAVIAALSGAVDETSTDYAEQAFRRALVTFAVARTLNGVISVAQGTEVAIEPGGVGVNFTVGQILDPVNDLVERFSAVMLVATSSLGLQNLLLTITGWWGITALLVVAAILVIAASWWHPGSGGDYRLPVLRVFLVVVFLRFAVPLLIVGSNVVFDAFMASEQAAATAALEATRVEIEELSDDAESPDSVDQTFIDRLGETIDDALETINVSDRISRLRETASNASEHIVNLIVIFVLQTIVLPLIFLWLFAEALKKIAARSARW